MKKKLVIVFVVLLVLVLGAKLFIDAAFKYILRAVVSVEDFSVGEIVPDIVVDFPETKKDEADSDTSDDIKDETPETTSVEATKPDKTETVDDVQVEETEPVKTEPVKESEDIIKVDSEKIDTIEKSVSTKDKMDAAAILLSKLTSEDINILTDMIKDGKVTSEDFNEAKSLISERITEEEKELLKELFLKYSHLLD